MERRRLIRLLAALAAWLVVTLLVAVPLFLNSHRELVLASHESVVRPTFGGELVVHTGPVLPDVRRASGGPLGVDITLGKTEARTTSELVERYAFIASQPASQVAKVRDAVLDMALSALIRGGLVAGLPLAIWLLLGRRRRRELLAWARGPRLVPVIGVSALVALLWWQPWQVRGPRGRRPGLAVAGLVPRAERPAAQGGGRGRGECQPDHRGDQAAGCQRGRHL